MLSQNRSHSRFSNQRFQTENFRHGENSTSQKNRTPMSQMAQHIWFPRFSPQPPQQKMTQVRKWWKTFATHRSAVTVAFPAKKSVKKKIKSKNVVKKKSISPNRSLSGIFKQVFKNGPFRHGENSQHKKRMSQMAQHLNVTETFSAFEKLRQKWSNFSDPPKLSHSGLSRQKFR